MQPPDRDALRSTLAAQCGELAVLGARVELASRTLLPSIERERERWRGPARNAYEADLDELRAGLDWAAALLGQARECGLRSLGALGGPWAMN